MGENSGVPYCDSSLNLQMGCDGCELWNKKRRSCYAGRMVQKFGNRKGWPVSFDQPAIFPDRVNDVMKWSDLTGEPRIGKPWLNGRPRVVFLDDMGDTFTESLPINWLSSFLMPLYLTPHVYILLTKRVSRMADFFLNHAATIPPNFWIGTSVTGPETLPRVEALHRLEYEAKKRFALAHVTTIVSAEPVVAPLPIVLQRNHDGPGGEQTTIDWLMIGGESDDEEGDAMQVARPMPLDWMPEIIEYAHEVGTKVFVKQLGSHWARENGGYGKGESPNKWPLEFRVREVPHDSRSS